MREREKDTERERERERSRERKRKIKRSQSRAFPQSCDRQAVLGRFNDVQGTILRPTKENTSLFLTYSMVPRQVLTTPHLGFTTDEVSGKVDLPEDSFCKAILQLTISFPYSTCYLTYQSKSEHRRGPIPQTPQTECGLGVSALAQLYIWFVARWDPLEYTRSATLRLREPKY